MLLRLFNFSTQTALANKNQKDRGTREEAKKLLDRAVALVKTNEVAAFSMMTVANTGFQTKDL